MKPGENIVMTKIKLPESQAKNQLQPILELALKAPLKKSSPQSLSLAFCLIPKTLLPLLGRFLLRHELNFKISALKLEEREAGYLLLITCRDRHSNSLIPDFVLAYIDNLPSCHVFQGFGEWRKGVIFLCEYGFNHPFDLDELVAKTSETGLYLSFGRKRSSNLIIRPLPELRADNSILEYSADFPLKYYDYVPGDEPESLQIDLRLIDIEPDVSASAAAIFLEKSEILWLKELLYHLPARLFEKIEWIGNQDYLFLFFTDAESISFFPFGRGFRRVTENLFIPSDQEIIPRLEEKQLDEIFCIESEHYVFVTREWRRNLPKVGAAPLQQLLTIDNDIKVEFRPDLNPLEFVWEEPALEDEAEVLIPPPELPESIGEKPAIPVAAQFEPVTTGGRKNGEDPVTIEKKLKEYATLLRRQGDFLGAATCFSLADESLAAADCYAEAARKLS